MIGKHHDGSTLASDSGNLHGAADILRNYNAALDSQQQQLISDLKALRAEWSESGSEAGQAFDTSTRKIDQHQSNITEITMNFSRTTADAGEGTIAVERTNTGLFPS